jgi:hypothetical protein
MSNTGKWLRVRVTDLQTGESKTNVRIPVSLADFGMKMAARCAPDSLVDLDMNQIMAAVKDGSDGLLVDVEDEEKGEHVEVFVE